MLQSNIAGGDTTEQHLVKVIGIGMHEDRLRGTAGRQRRNGRLGLHVLHRIHTDAQMRQQSLRQYLAQLIIDRRSAGRNSITTSIATQRTKEGAVRRTGVQAMQTVDDVQSFLVRFEWTDRLRSVTPASESLLVIPSGIQVFGSKP